MAVSKQFRESSFPVHFILDLWSSPSHPVFCGLIGHWIKKGWNLNVAILSMEQLTGYHTGLNQDAAIWEGLQQYNLIRKVGYFTTDNVTNNNLALYELATYFQAEDIAFDSISSQICCFEHIINLGVKGF
jgi:hypothetical protein